MNRVNLSSLDYNFKNNLKIILAFFVLLSYFIIYFFFLYKAKFLPYVFDNNETFSNLMHAQNLYLFGFKSTYGLTDEAFSIFKEAHPYVYTHQGNFPRFYSFLLYWLGFRSAEIQIAITTFTIGLVGLGFCYYFFSRYISTLFAAIFSVLLITDYIMFMQWQTNTWRVWHLFFFFASFICCHGLNNQHKRIYIALTILNFACLFYTELAFATFIYLSGFCYLSIFKNISWRQKGFCLLIISLGSIFGVGILIIQNIAFLGLDVFKKDLFFTFIVRNNSKSLSFSYNDIFSFYSAHKIAFWDSYNNSTIDKNNIYTSLNGFYQSCLLTYPRYLTLGAFISILGITISWFSQSFQNKFVCSLLFRALTYMILIYSIILFFYILTPHPKTIKLLIIFTCISSFLAIFQKKIKQLIFNYTVLAFLKPFSEPFLMVGTSLFLLSLTFITIFSYPDWTVNQTIMEIKKPQFISSLLFLGILFFVQLRNLNIQPQMNRKFVLVVISTFFFLSIDLDQLFFLLTIHSPKILIQKSLSTIGGVSFLPIVIGAILLLSTPFINFYYPTNKPLTIFKKLFPFLISCCFGAIFAYLIFPGYIQTAYLARFCCFTVFFHITLYAWLFYVMVISILSLVNHLLLQYKSKIQISNSSKLTKIKLFFLAIILITFSYSWIGIQWFYNLEFPADNFTFIKLLKTEPFYKKSIVSNAYVAPFAFQNHSWAYFDPMFYLNLRENNTKVLHFKLQHNFKYLWLADRLNNINYLKPNLFICWVHDEFGYVGKRKNTCGDLPFIKTLRKHRDENTKIKEIAHDPSQRDKWSIVSLNN